ncbi:MAG: hypothetical protein LBB41_03815 [Prevotellaceae bacterium]|jgi:hypothetical protein|nr:hypothetical protein [Prevotellaceae bacterium]
MNKKIIFSIFVTVMAMVFAGCDKNNNNNFSGANENSTGIFKLPTDGNSQNPYAFLGEMHNKGLAEGLREFYHSDLNKADVTEKEIANFASQFTVKFVEGEIVKMENVSDVEALRANLQTSIEKSNFQWFATAKLENVSAEVAKSGLTKFQKEKLIALFNVISINDDALVGKLQAFEVEILQSNVSDSEKAPLLAAIAISRSSLDFWTKHIISDNANSSMLKSSSSNPSIVMVEEKGDIFIKINEGEGFRIRQHILDAFKADALGAVGGVIGGVIGGHAGVGLVFGPGGVVCTLAADAVIGAISSSIVGGTGSVFNWW